jgi:hypothetical protein
MLAEVVARGTRCTFSPSRHASPAPSTVDGEHGADDKSRMTLVPLEVRQFSWFLYLTPLTDVLSINPRRNWKEQENDVDSRFIQTRFSAHWRCWMHIPPTQTRSDG